ncbi:DUF6233 domain-containing protein [Streptomyces sp. MN13]
MAKIAPVWQRRAEKKRGRLRRPAPPEWVAAVGIGAGREPAEVHAGGCHMTGDRWRAMDRDEARHLLSSGMRACSHCQPDLQLHINRRFCVGSGDLMESSRVSSRCPATDWGDSTRIDYVGVEGAPGTPHQSRR